MDHHTAVNDPHGPAMDQLCAQLEQWSPRWSRVEDWPADSLQLCGRSGVFRWFLPTAQGGLGWSDADQIRGYLRLAEVDLTTTFVITQYVGAIRRIAYSENETVAEAWLGRLIRGEAFTTVGFSHLTTSRQHLGRPALEATSSRGGFVLRGMSPWVTGVPHAQIYVIGATLSDGREILAAIPADTPGLTAGDGCGLVALSASCTDRLELDDVFVPADMLLAGPTTNVMRSGVGATTGGLQTSTLAIGLARAAANFLDLQASQRPDVARAAAQIRREVDTQQARLLDAAESKPGDTPGRDPAHVGAGETDASRTNSVRFDLGEIRGDANRLALRATQAALTAAKGAGFLASHSVGRWCQEALFFLVWSCPQPVANAQLCELATFES